MNCSDIDGITYVVGFILILLLTAGILFAIDEALWCLFGISPLRRIHKWLNTGEF